MAFFKLGKLISAIQFSTINYVINIDINSNLLALLDRYMNLDALYASHKDTFFSNSKINLQIKSIDLSLPSGSLLSSKASVFMDSSLSLRYYSYIYLLNIIWSPDLSNMDALNIVLFEVLNDYFILDQV